MFGLGKKKKDDFSGEGKFPPEDAPFPDTPFPSGNDSGNAGLPPLGQKQPTPPNQYAQPSAPQNDMGQDPFQKQPSFGAKPGSFDKVEQPKAPTTTQSTDKDELILAKLDNIRSMIDVLNQRMATLESKLDHQRKW